MTALLPLPENTKDWRWYQHAFMWLVVAPLTILWLPVQVAIDSYQDWKHRP